MLTAAPLNLFIWLADIDFLPAECTAALPTDDPTAERIAALINLYIIHAVFLPAIFINLTYRLRFFSADDRFMVIRYQILWQFPVIILFVNGIPSVVYVF